jgi:hypothetical protein
MVIVHWLVTLNYITSTSWNYTYYIILRYLFNVKTNNLTKGFLNGPSEYFIHNYFIRLSVHPTL